MFYFLFYFFDWLRGFEALNFCELLRTDELISGRCDKLRESLHIVSSFVKDPPSFSLVEAEPEKFELLIIA